MTVLSTSPHAMLDAQQKPSIFTQLTIFALALSVIALVWGQFDMRTVDGVPVWLKPTKFGISFVIHFGTLAIIVASLTPKLQKHILVLIASWVLTTAFLGEMAYMIFQAAQAEKSHFNFSSEFHSMMYSLMGVGAAMLISAPILVAWVARRDQLIGPATSAGIWWGALVSFALTLITAGYLGSNGGALIGSPTDPSRVIPFFGWSTEVGDLRPAHFLALHAFQILPLAGLWADRNGKSASLILLIAGVYSIITLAIFAQALLGIPLVSF